MTVLEQISNPYVASLALGLLYGFTVCTSACLPYVASYIAGIKAGFRKGVAVTAVYNSGRIVAYAVIGSIAGLLRTFINDAFFETYQTVFSLIFGFVVILIGINIFFKKPSCNTCMPKNVEAQGGFHSFRQNFDLRAFAMGFSRGFVLCPPLVAFLLYAVANYQANYTVLAVLFGLGTALSPMLILAGVVGWLLEKAPLFRKWTSMLGGVVLVLLGVSVLLFTLIEFL
ncbi:MAG TPA: sulfite exporter TauE/SafE family protein [Candidatus Bathyarchaeota archaeon]|nr:sulfite exporter TauE/SafE family protein [Candidatus Bathyarchaeota archaeon]